MTGVARAWRLSGAMVLLGVLAVGVALRVHRRAELPPGLNQDEAAAAYEAVSLLETGRDRWGHRLPPYFLGWGSGQSTLLSYLAVPFVAVLGPGTDAIRLPALLVALATLPLFHASLRRESGPAAALVGTALLAASPWHVMLSRWALDANLLPFTLLLAVFVTQRARDGCRPARWLCLPSFALTLYAYGTSVFVTPALVALIAVRERATLRRHWRGYALGAWLALPIAAPFALFLVKNAVVHGRLPGEDALPFDLPLLAVTRLEQGQARTLPTNAEFLLSGLRDELVWNALPAVDPLPAPTLFLALGALLLALARCVPRAARAEPVEAGRKPDFYALWLLACVPLLLLVPVNVNRGNALFLPLVALAAQAAVALDQALAGVRLRQALRLAGALLLVAQTVRFSEHYFGQFPRLAAEAFNRGLDAAVATATASLRPGEALGLTESLRLGYVYLALLDRVPPARFQKDVVRVLEPGRGIDVRRLGDAFFHVEDLPADRPFVYLARRGEEPICSDAEPLLESKWWRVYRCRPRGARGGSDSGG